MTQIRWRGTWLLGALLTIGCGETEPPDTPELEAQPTSSQPASTSTLTRVPERQALFGDLHIHTRWSFDAYSLGVPVTPEDAYRYARGAAIDHVSGTKIQMQGPPLDFMALTEHSEYMGVSAAVDNPDHPFRDIGLVAELTSPDPQVSAGALLKFAQSLASGIGLPELLTDDVIKPIWARVVEYANEYNDLWVVGEEGFDPANPFRNSQALYFLPSLNEWVKAARYDPNANDGAGGYWDFPTGSDAEPTPVASGTAADTAVYNLPF